MPETLRRDDGRGVDQAAIVIVLRERSIAGAKCIDAAFLGGHVDGAVGNRGCHYWFNGLLLIIQRRSRCTVFLHCLLWRGDDYDAWRGYTSGA